MTDRFLVTGAAGFLGQHLVAALRRAHPKATIVGTDLFKNPHPAVTIENACDQVVYGIDILDPSGLDGLLDPGATLVHAAGYVSFWSKDREKLFRINVEGTRSILRSAVRNKACMFIQVSSVAALGYANDPDVLVDEEFTFPFEKFGHKPYMVTKKRADDLVLAASRSGEMPAIVVHPALMWGRGDHKNMSRLLLAAQRGELRASTPGGTYVADVEDIAQGIACAAARGASGSRYILGGYNLSFSEINATVCDVVGAKPPISRVPPWIKPVAYHASRLIETCYPKPPKVTSDNIDSAFSYRYFDHGKAERELHWRAEKPFRTSVSEQWDYLRTLPGHEA